MKATELEEEGAKVRSPCGGMKNLATLSDFEKMIRLLKRRPLNHSKTVKRLLRRIKRRSV